MQKGGRDTGMLRKGQFTKIEHDINAVAGAIRLKEIMRNESQKEPCPGRRDIQHGFVRFGKDGGLGAVAKTKQVRASREHAIERRISEQVTTRTSSGWRNAPPKKPPNQTQNTQKN